MIKVWQEVDSKGTWTLIYEAQADSSVNCISWAPWEYGLILAAGAKDGQIIIIRRDGSDWKKKSVNAHNKQTSHISGVIGISWCHSSLFKEESVLQDGKQVQLSIMKLASVSTDDSSFKIWEYDGDNLIEI